MSIMVRNKSKLSLDEQIEHLKERGITFEIMDEDDAREYLDQNNNYFKLTAYRKNYPKHPDGKNKGKYIKLEFAYLVDIAIIDMKLRYQIVHMALDIEHHTKLHLLKKIDQYNEDGYQIVEEYIKALDSRQKNNFEGEINRSKNSIYCGDIIDKYNGAYPIWAFIEIISLGRLVDFYGFCARKFEDKEMKGNYFNLLTCKKIRNAAAHSNCILNDLRASTAYNKTNAKITQNLSKIKELKTNFRKNRMSNVRIQQIITLLYMHKKLVKSKGLKQLESEKIHKIMERMYAHFDYYQENQMIHSSFNFLKIVIDNWF